MTRWPLYGRANGCPLFLSSHVGGSTVKCQLLFMQLVSLNKDGIYVIIGRSSARGIYVQMCCLCTDLFIDVNKIVILPVVLYGCKNLVSYRKVNVKCESNLG